MFAEVDRIVALSDLPKPISILDPHRLRPREVLKQIGIYEITGDSSDVVPKRDDVVFWRATRGADQSGYVVGPILEFVADKANKDHAKQVELSGIWRGVSEAVANTVEHAYLLPRADGYRHADSARWWMFTQIRDQTFVAAVCDLGCGYRQTVRRTIPEAFRQTLRAAVLADNADSFAIRVAMEYGRSGTHATHRGKGSRDALSVLATHGNGELSIFSNSGRLRYVYQGGKECECSSHNIGVDIKGTIILWKLPLAEVTNDHS